MALLAGVERGDYGVVRQRLLACTQMDLDQLLAVAVVQEPDSRDRQLIVDALLFSGAKPTLKTLQNSHGALLEAQLLTLPRDPALARLFLQTCLTSFPNVLAFATRFLTLVPSVLEGDGSVLAAVHDISVPLASLLLEHKANPHPLTNDSALLQAIKRRHVDLVSLYLRATCDLTNAHNLLMTVVRKAPSVEIASLLMAKGVKVEEAGSSAFFEAAKRGNLPLMKCLFSGVSNVNARFRFLDDDLTVLMIVCAAGHSHTFPFLKEAKADVNALSMLNLSALDYSCQNAAITRALLDAFSPVTCIARNMFTLMEETRNYDVVRLLVEHVATHEEATLVPEEWDIPECFRKQLPEGFQWSARCFIFACILSAPWHPDRLAFIKGKPLLFHNCWYLELAFCTDQDVPVDCRLISLMLSEGATLYNNTRFEPISAGLVIHAYLEHVENIAKAFVGAVAGQIIAEFVWDPNDVYVALGRKKTRRRKNF